MDACRQASRASSHWDRQPHGASRLVPLPRRTARRLPGATRPHYHLRFQGLRFPRRGRRQRHPKDVRPPLSIYVPPKYVGLFLNHRLTPREIADQVLPVIVADGNVGMMEPFIDWCMAASYEAVANANHPAVIHANDAVVTIGDAAFLQWRQSILHRMLPGILSSGPGSTATATVRIASLMGDLFTEQRQTRADTTNARAAASQPKSVSAIKDEESARIDGSGHGKREDRNRK